MEKTATWSPVIYHMGEEPLGHQAIVDLVENRISGIVLKGVLDPESMVRTQAAIDQFRQSAVTSSYINGSLTTIGPYLARHISQPEAYFDQAHTTDQLFPDPTYDLRAQVRATLLHVLGLDQFDVAEQEGKSYAPAIFRLHADGVANPLHNDLIVRDSAHTDLYLKELVAQLSCVVCIQECDFGGELVHYQKVWQAEDESFKIPQGLGYDEGVVADVERWTYKPETGDVYIINPTNYHEIKQVGGAERRTMGFFFGFFDDELKKAVVWA